MIEKLLDDLKLGSLGIGGLGSLAELDLSKLNIPKNIIYLIIAFKLINNLDKIIPQKVGTIPNFKNMCPIGKMPMSMKSTGSNSNFMSLFVIFLLIGGALILANNLLDKINISLMSCGVNSLRNSNIKLPTNRNMSWCPMKEMKGCPMGKCPMKEPMEEGKCPLKNMSKFMENCPKMKKCPFFSNELEEKIQKLIEEKDKIELELLNEEELINEEL
tara:strand:- start:3639 stop:4286 length:648 start_codon:yes stop_codon:yes gene_type:complete